MGCREAGCDCSGFTPHAFKKGKCRACFHPKDMHDISDVAAEAEQGSGADTASNASGSPRQVGSNVKRLSAMISNIEGLGGGGSSDGGGSRASTGSDGSSAGAGEGSPGGSGGGGGVRKLSQQLQLGGFGGFGAPRRPSSTQKRPDSVGSAGSDGSNGSSPSQPDAHARDEKDSPMVGRRGEGGSPSSSVRKLSQQLQLGGLGGFGAPRPPSLERKSEAVKEDESNNGPSANMGGNSHAGTSSDAGSESNLLVSVTATRAKGPQGRRRGSRRPSRLLQESQALAETHDKPPSAGAATLTAAALPPDLPATKPDKSESSPDLPATKPDKSESSPDLPATKPDKSESSPVENASIPSPRGGEAKEDGGERKEEGGATMSEVRASMLVENKSSSEPTPMAATEGKETEVTGGGGSGSGGSYRYGSGVSSGTVIEHSPAPNHPIPPTPNMPLPLPPRFGRSRLTSTPDAAAVSPARPSDTAKEEAQRPRFSSLPPSAVSLRAALVASPPASPNSSPPQDGRGGANAQVTKRGDVNSRSPPLAPVVDSSVVFGDTPPQSPTTAPVVDSSELFQDTDDDKSRPPSERITTVHGDERVSATSDPPAATGTTEEEYFKTASKKILSSLEDVIVQQGQQLRGQNQEIERLREELMHVRRESDEAKSLLKDTEVTQTAAEVTEANADDVLKEQQRQMEEKSKQIQQLEAELARVKVDSISQQKPAPSDSDKGKEGGCAGDGLEASPTADSSEKESQLESDHHKESAQSTPESKDKGKGKGKVYEARDDFDAVLSKSEDQFADEGGSVPRAPPSPLSPQPLASALVGASSGGSAANMDNSSEEETEVKDGSDPYDSDMTDPMVERQVMAESSLEGRDVVSNLPGISPSPKFASPETLPSTDDEHADLPSATVATHFLVHRGEETTKIEIITPWNEIASLLNLPNRSFLVSSNQVVVGPANPQALRGGEEYWIHTIDKFKTRKHPATYLNHDETMPYHNFNGIRFLVVEGSQPFFFYFNNTQLFVVFRGGPENVSERAYQTEFHDEIQNAVHKALWARAETVPKDTLISEARGHRKVILCGYGVGGAIAHVVNLQMRRCCEEDPTRDARFSRFIESRGWSSKFLNINTRGDVVPFMLGRPEMYSMYQKTYEKIKDDKLLKEASVAFKKPHKWLREFSLESGIVQQARGERKTIAKCYDPDHLFIGAGVSLGLIDEEKESNVQLWCGPTPPDPKRWTCIDHLPPTKHLLHTYVEAFHGTIGEVKYYPDKREGSVDSQSSPSSRTSGGRKRSFLGRKSQDSDNPEGEFGPLIQMIETRPDSTQKGHFTVVLKGRNLDYICHYSVDGFDATETPPRKAGEGWSTRVFKLAGKTKVSASTALKLKTMFGWKRSFAIFHTYLSRTTVVYHNNLELDKGKTYTITPVSGEPKGPMKLIQLLSAWTDALDSSSDPRTWAIHSGGKELSKSEYFDIFPESDRWEKMNSAKGRPSISG